MNDGAVHKRVSNGDVGLAVCEAGDRNGPTIVFIHGYPDTKEMWNGVLDRLPARYNAVAYDVRGAGESSRPRGNAAYDFERLGDDLLAVADAVAPGKPIHLVGHDWGGLQGWEFATQPRFEGRLASFTAIAAPSLDQVAIAGDRLLWRGRLLQWAGRLRRSWYIVPLLTPGAPTLVWRVLWSVERWRWMLRTLERVPAGGDEPRPTLASDGIHGAKLYRRNMARRAIRPRTDAVAHVPVQLVVPTGDRFIPSGYYDLAEQYAPRLRRRTVGSGHWAPRAQPERIARWIAAFVDEVESGVSVLEAPRPWKRGGGVGQLRGRLALVTGAASGIGAATARALADHGARPLLVDRDGEGAARVAESIAGAHSFACDVSDEGAMERLAGAVLGEHGVPMVVVNNAGIAVPGSFLDTEFDDWRRVLGINLMGVVHGSRLFGRAMVEQGEGGHIVNTASAAAFGPSKSLPAYCASKAAVLMLSECLRAELLGDGIGVTAVCPGIVATNITKTAHYVGRSADDEARVADQVTRLYERRRYTPERVAQAIVAAIAEDKPVAVVTPEAKLMHAMWRFAPGLLRRLARADGLPV